MSLDDPFLSVKDDVEASLIHVQELFNRYGEVSKTENATDQEWILTELRNSLRSVEWDLEDLSETIGIVEKNPGKFRLKPQEISERRRFIQDSKNLIRDIGTKMAGADSRFKDRNVFVSQPGTTTSEQSPAFRTQYKYSRLLDSDVDGPASSSSIPNTHSASGGGRDFTNNMLEQQQLIMRGQDEDLDKIGNSVHVLKNMSHRIGTELEEQSVMLDDLGRDMDRTDSKLDTVMKKLAKVTHMSNDKRQWYAILVLVVILVIVIILFAAL